MICFIFHQFIYNRTMATIKMKFRPSSVPEQEGTIFFQVIHNRMTRQVRTSFRLFSHEWNSRAMCVVCAAAGREREAFLHDLHCRVVGEYRKLEEIVAGLERKGAGYTADDVLAAYSGCACASYTFFGFMREVIASLKQMGQLRTSETYTAALKSFVRFRDGVDLLFDDFDSVLLGAYEAYLKRRGVSRNTSSFYMRILRAVYNRALECGRADTAVNNPFRHVYTGVDKTVKRAITLEAVRRIMRLDLKDVPMQDFARDMFMFSFYTRGMSFVDMAYLSKKALQNGFLTYRRKKTGQQLVIRWEKCMQKIVDKYDTAGSPYLLPIIRSFADERTRYKSAGHLVNRNLKMVGRKADLSVPLSMYVARHSWASVAKNKNIPVAVISEGMGHDSESTTRIYLASLDTSVIDKANRLILSALS